MDHPTEGTSHNKKSDKSKNSLSTTIFVFLVSMMVFYYILTYTLPHIAAMDNGKKSYEEKNYEKAIYHFQKAVDIKPSDSDAHRQLGLAFFAVGRYQEALDQFS